MAALWQRCVVEDAADGKALLLRALGAVYAQQGSPEALPRASISYTR